MVFGYLLIQNGTDKESMITLYVYVCRQENVFASQHVSCLSTASRIMFQQCITTKLVYRLSKRLCLSNMKPLLLHVDVIVDCVLQRLH